MHIMYGITLYIQKFFLKGGKVKSMEPYVSANEDG